MKILAIDIETSPNLAYVWGLWDQNVSLNQLVETGEIICWAAKWIGDEGIIFHSTHSGTKKKMVKEAWKLLDEADVVIHFNGKRFDIPWLNREFLEQKLPPPSPYKQIDLMTVAKQFKFPSYKMAYVTERLGLQGKIKHEGFDLWVKCMAGDSDAWSKMEEYNVRDVIELEELYAVLKPWIKSHPSWGAFTGKDVCPKCMSEDLKPRGWAYTTQGRYRRLICGSCGTWTRSTTGGETTKIVQI